MLHRMRTSGPSPRAGWLGAFRHHGWSIAVVTWFLFLCAAPDPRPLAAPAWAVGVVRDAFGAAEPIARAVATVVLRESGLGVLGLLLALAAVALSGRRAPLFAPLFAPVLAVLAMTLNYGYFPIAPQLLLGSASALLGALLGLALQRSRPAAGLFALLLVALFAWGTSVRIPDHIATLARPAALRVLERVDEVPGGDAGFLRLVEETFAHSARMSPGDPVLANRAAILALGVLLGDEAVARIGGRQVDPERIASMARLRDRITLRERGDLARHFWVSAALAEESDRLRSISVGIAKEMMDAQPGGSGFSFVDLMADEAGVRFARAASRDEAQALAMQRRIARGLAVGDLLPPIEGLPEGIARDVFQQRYGGLNGSGTRQVVAEIDARLETAAALH